MVLQNERKKYKEKYKVFTKNGYGFIVSNTGLRLFYFNQEAPCIIIIGPSGGGKSTCYYYPNILDIEFNGGSIIFDYKKNENYRQTAKILEKQGRIVIKFEPGNPNSPVKINPFDLYEFDLSILCSKILSVGDLAYKAIYGVQYKTTEEQWKQMAQCVVKGYVYHIAASKPNNNFTYLRKLLRMRTEERDKIIMNSPSKKAREEFELFYNTVIGSDGKVNNERMYGSIMNTILSKVTEIIDEKVCGCTDCTTFDPSVLLGGITLRDAIKFKLVTVNYPDLRSRGFCTKARDSEEYNNRTACDTKHFYSLAGASAISCSSPRLKILR